MNLGPRRRNAKSFTNKSSFTINPNVVVLVICLCLFLCSTHYLMKFSKDIAREQETEKPTAMETTDRVPRPRKLAVGEPFHRDNTLDTLSDTADQLHNTVNPALNLADSSKSSRGRVLVSYAYYEKDHVQKANFEFFIIVGMGIDSTFPQPKATDFVVVVNGRKCEPCSALLPDVEPVEAPTDSLYNEVKESQFLTLIFRWENKGMDLAAHNMTIQWATLNNRLQKYKYFIFLNSSARGPFYPNYMPSVWQWTDAFTSFFVDDVKAVGCSLTCLPDSDEGGRGPKLESWAFALDSVGLSVAMAGGAFVIRTCKLCEDGIVVLGEYGITNVILSKGYNIATLLAKYDRGIDWRDDSNWNCNDQVHASRHGSYDGIDMHPFETLFVKSSWHVGEPFTGKYSKWFMHRALGRSTTAGTFDIQKYYFFISESAQQGSDMSNCYPWLKGNPRTRG